MVSPPAGGSPPARPRRGEAGTRRRAVSWCDVDNAFCLEHLTSRPPLFCAQADNNGYVPPAGNVPWNPWDAQPPRVQLQRQAQPQAGADDEPDHQADEPHPDDITAEELLPKRAAARAASAAVDRGEPLRCCRLKGDGTPCGSHDIAWKTVSYALLGRVYLCKACRKVFKDKAALLGRRTALTRILEAREGRNVFTETLQTVGQKLKAAQEELVDYEHDLLTPDEEQLVDEFPLDASPEEFQQLLQDVAPGFLNPNTAEETDDDRKLREIVRRLDERRRELGV